MATPFFKFKNFTVWHDKCAMKVGTDGVLLGSWATVSDCSRILDVGTGTGLIALMLAQRSNAIIEAIDIDEAACNQAKENIEASAFKDQIKVSCTSIQNYAVATDQRYDLIVSNPPYFLNSLKGPDNQRNKARHNDTLPLIQLLNGSRQLLTPNGKVSLILPASQQDELNELLPSTLLFTTRETLILPTPQSAPKRILVELSANQAETCEKTQLIIEEGRHQYTNDYKDLTRDYYLKM